MTPKLKTVRVVQPDGAIHIYPDVTRLRTYYSSSDRATVTLYRYNKGFKWHYFKQLSVGRTD